MALILHLSDLHLTGLATPAVTADHKADVVRKQDSGHRSKLLRTSLHGLGEELRKNNEVLDAIIISGDISDKGSEEGYLELPDVLAELKTSLPTPDRVLIVPGNHDVDRAATGDSRFARIRKLRDHGYLVGWLSEAEIDVEPAPILHGGDGSYVIAGVNSSLYSGSTLSTETDLEKHLSTLEKMALTKESIRTLLAAWRERGGADLARVSDRELAALHANLEPALADGSGPLRIVMLHHQLIPVDTNEEIKPFESMTNLGYFRRWLESNSIDLVLHGHKHHAKILRDRIDSGSSNQAHELTIMSAPSVVNARGADEPIAQIIRVPTASPRSGDYQAILVPAVEAGTTSPFAQMHRRQRPLHEQAMNGVLAGANIDAVYVKIQAVAERAEELPTPLVCRVENGATALSLPLHMVDVPTAGAERDEWLNTVIEWWQRKDPGRAASFNHGQFLHRQGRHKESAVERMVDELRRGSSRAIAILVNQQTVREAAEYPSFITLQLVAKQDFVHAVAYFRKQELLHWWPINLVEIARIQEQVVRKLSNYKTWKCGSITTVTAVPVVNAEMPTVAVPKLDLLVDDPGALLKLVLPLFSAPSAGNDVVELWTAHFADWVPQDLQQSAPHTLPRLGLKELADTVDAAAESFPPNPEVNRLVRELRHLVTINKEYREENYQMWVQNARGQSAVILEQIQHICASRNA
jgi:3',5'-cyclic AMP phosphodiesterase CpdA